MGAGEREATADCAENADGRKADRVGLIRAIRVIRGRSAREESVETDRVDGQLPGWVQGRGRRPRIARRTRMGKKADRVGWIRAIRKAPSEAWRFSSVERN